MSKSIEEMIIEICNRLNLVNPGLIDPENYSENDREDIEDIHAFVTSKRDFTPREMTGITEALGDIRK
ncbi:DUF1128 domain-containing protein [Staphylococcus pseudintermedius]|uniref:DUF1128 family protein n=1 Tax=Staphylococcus pseudintermedius TaxID=283734 RepID=UPI000D7370B9|nr:DUF1128 family protein [Staphylococcus pseudintermedius]EIU0294597.1 DUF1128 domain-containing protein [Staphylococcus pseudintermedius]EIW3385262.1 DUF1128 domain-containing protein [Staphylococcus pseudintermedius]PXA18032.1 DUF1128 domain-containing protein [Staphylococcus pseudintermedius]HCA7791943.1 DUF1128 domain-containing protein [Staphylococcus pseudintermedius]HDV6027638.1 DUF1128 domain-containing protein [Staphylococcus pseudintermedius]